jgi:hypothetical protein
MQFSGVDLAEDVGYIGGKQRQKSSGAFPITPSQNRRRQICGGFIERRDQIAPGRPSSMARRGKMNFMQDEDPWSPCGDSRAPFRTREPGLG